MQNVVALVGRLTKDPEVKVIGEGTSVCNFTLAVNRPYKNKDGEHEADFIQCQAWKSQAEFIGSYMKKGNLIAINGSINTRTYDKDGVTKYITEVNVSQVQSLEKKDTNSQVAEKNSAQLKEQWTAEWNKRSVGLDPASSETLRKELATKYQPLVDAAEKKESLPF